MTERYQTDPSTYPVSVHVEAQVESRNRLTTAFRFFLALPHLVLVGGPLAIAASVYWSADDGSALRYSGGGGAGGLIGLVAFLGVVGAWVAILITARYPNPLWTLVTWYLRWRARAVAYMTLLRDEYPPFGDDPYPVRIRVPERKTGRSRLTVFFRVILAVPHMLVLWFLGVAWAFTTALAWAAILLTGRFPEPLYGFGLGVFAWSLRVEGYLLLLTDEYPPFSLRT